MDEPLRRLLETVATTRLCYGEPVREGDRTVIPVARVRVAGGWGFGRGGEDEGSGGGGGGSLEGTPVGFIEVGADGARFVEIADPERTQRLLRAGAAAVGTVLTVALGARRLRGGGGRRPAGLLGR